MQGNIIQLRTNCDFSLQPDTGILHAVTELIILSKSVKYKMVKGKPHKTEEINESRYKISRQGLEVVIYQLQQILIQHAQFEKLGKDLSQMIEVTLNTNQKPAGEEVNLKSK